MSYSLRSNLIVWLGVPLLVSAGVFLVENYYNAHRAANAAHDNALYASALAIADRVVLNGTSLEVDLPYIALEMLSATGDDHVYYRVIGGDKTFITGYKDLPDPPANVKDLQNDDAVFFDSRFRGQTVRIAELKRVIHRQSRDFHFTVYVAETVGEREKLARELTITFGSRFLLLIAIIIAAGWVGAGRALRPLKRFEQSLRQRSHHDLRPVDVEVPSEINVVVAAINQLMERLRQSFTEIRTFVDDASHQLRTPLTSLKTQIEVALNEPDPEKVRSALKELLASTTRTGRLAEQLLIQAKTVDTLDFDDMDMNELAEGVTRSWVVRALDGGIDLGLDCSREPLPIRGSPTLLEELLNNLINNAVQYSPKGSSVTVRTTSTGTAAVVEVQDDGPGIPEALHDDAVKRFRRFDKEHTDGCGLGLAIAKDIAQLHHGSLSLSRGAGDRGLLVRVEVPLSAK